MANKLRASEQIQDKDRYIPVSEAKKQMVAMLTEIQLEIEEFMGTISPNYDEAAQDISKVIQQKINELKGNEDQYGTISN